ncbi:MAG: hypothetical protein AB8A46_04075 [Prochlorococcus sp.]|nr:hypothetical protein [Prochlorococcus sp.]
MSFDPHSLERLRELGRQLPKPLSSPEKPAQKETRASEQRHRVETEEDPQALFRELMQVSPDGNVPTHLMARLKDVEDTQKKQQRQDASNQISSRNEESLPSTPASTKAGKGKSTLPQRRRLAAGSEEESLYVAFGQLLLEDEDET